MKWASFPDSLGASVKVFHQQFSTDLINIIALIKTVIIGGLP